MPSDTIAAIATPPGRGGIGIVRLSGPDAWPITSTLVRLRRPLEPTRATLAEVLDPNPDPNPDPNTPESTPIDEAVVTPFRAPHSYTGEDVVEISTHGAPIVLETLLRAALAHGARLAEPGEFTQRAFLNRRLDLTQAEAVHDLIAAHTLEQARMASQQLAGALSRRIAPIKDSLLTLIALLEAGMDFAPGELDDVDLVPPEQIRSTLAAIQTPLEQLARSYTAGHRLREGATLALVGQPNVGKSSLFNRLLDRDRAIVTPIPGTTRDTVEDTTALAGIPLRLIDTAGLRLAGDSPADQAEALGIARSREALADADLVLLVLDAAYDLSPEEHSLLASLRNRPHLVVRNKADLLPPCAPHLFPNPTPTPQFLSSEPPQSGCPGSGLSDPGGTTRPAPLPTAVISTGAAQPRSGETPEFPSPNPLISTATTHPANPVISTDAATPNPVISTGAAQPRSGETPEFPTPNPMISTATTHPPNPVISTDPATPNPVISTGAAQPRSGETPEFPTPDPIISTATTHPANPVISTDPATPNPVISTGAAQPRSGETPEFPSQPTAAPTALISTAAAPLANPVISTGAAQPRSGETPEFPSQPTEPPTPLPSTPYPPPPAPLYTSAITGQGLNDLRAAILNLLRSGADPTTSGALNSLRQHQAVTAALDALDAATRANATGIPHEFLLADLHTALRALDFLTGHTTPDDILHRIFSTFCIGK